MMTIIQNNVRKETELSLAGNGNGNGNKEFLWPIKYIFGIASTYSFNEIKS